MISDTAWIEEAHRLHEAGTPVPTIFRALGKSEYAVRMALDIDGYCERKRQQAAAQKQRCKLAREASQVRKDRYRDRTKPVEVATPAKPKVTLPALAFLAKPIEETKPAFRLAPKTHCRVEKPGVATIREIHRRMIRAGRIADPSLIQELRS